MNAKVNINYYGMLLLIKKLEQCGFTKQELQRIAERLGFVPGDLPESIPLFTACALERLLRKH